MIKYAVGPNGMPHFPKVIMVHAGPAHMMNAEMGWVWVFGFGSLSREA